MVCDVEELRTQAVAFARDDFAEDNFEAVAAQVSHAQLVAMTARFEHAQAIHLTAAASDGSIAGRLSHCRVVALRSFMPA
jgi:hypothetical protein